MVNIQEDNDLAVLCGVVLLGLGLLAASFLIFWNLGSGSIDLRDEALTAGRSLYIYHSHSILNLEVNGELSIRKPPLVYLLTALSYKIFGVNELGLRFPNAIFGLGVFFVIAWGAWCVIGPIWAGISPWILIGCFNLIRVSREALTDTTFVFGMTLSFVAVFVHLYHISSIDFKHTKYKNYILPIAFSIGVAISLFSKGPLGLYVVIYTLIFLLFCARSLVLTYLFFSLAATLPFLFWLVVQAVSLKDFLSIYLGQEYLKRVDYDSDYLKQFIRSPFWYLSNLWRWFRISGFIAVIMSIWILACYTKRYKTCPPSWQKSTSYLFLALGWIGYFLLLSAVSHKSRRYILPIFPLMTLIYLVGIKETFILARVKTSRFIVLNLIILSVLTGLFATKSHYLPIPDYLPLRKEAAMWIKSLDTRGLNIYTDDPRLAPILHFYLDKVVPLVHSEKEIAGDNWVFVTNKPIPGAQRINQNYYVVVHK